MKWRSLTVVVTFGIAVVCGTAVNFLAKLAALTEPPIALNGWRTLVAGGLLAVPMLLLGVSFRTSRKEVVWYSVLALLTMALPHAMIFLALRTFGTSVATVAFVEAAVLGIVIVYLFASGGRIAWGAILSGLFTLVGLAVFLGINPTALTLGTGELLVIGAAVFTGAGFIVAERLKPHGSASTLADRCRVSMKKTFFACVLSGGGTLLVLATAGAAGQGGEASLPAASAWPWIIVLAVVGSCLTWFSVFLLINLGELMLAAAVIAAAPIATEVANYIWFMPDVTSVTQWVGGVTVLLALMGLIWFQLVRGTRAHAAEMPPAVVATRINADDPIAANHLSCN